MTGTVRSSNSDLRPPSSPSAPVGGSQLSTLNPQPTGRLAYILASSHSGSTLLAMLLGAHPEAVTVGELTGARTKDASLYRCSCGAFISHCSFWRRVVEEMKNGGLTYQPYQAETDIRDLENPYLRRILNPLHRGRFIEGIRDGLLGLHPAWHRHLAKVQQRNAALIQALLRLTHARIIVDSGKTGLRLKYLLRNGALEISVIRLIRDGRAVALTMMDTPTYADASDPAFRFGGAGEDASWRGYSMAHASRVWRRSNEEAEALVAGLPASQWTRIRYEDLCSNPQATSRCLSQFLKLDPERCLLDFRSVEQHVVGNGMRLDKTSTIRLDERWRSHLSNTDLEIFDKVAGRLNRQYGYE